MPKHFYRYRPIRALLDGHQELENQEIYFAPPSEFNDPHEGVRDVFWLGDRVVWKNLHRHYLRCLTRLIQLWCAGAGEHVVGWEHVPLFDPCLPNVPGAELFQLDARIEDSFFTPEAEAYIDALAARTMPVRREELRAHIGTLNPFALATILSCHEAAGFPMSKPGGGIHVGAAEQFKFCFKASIELIERAESMGEEPGSKVELAELFESFERTRAQMTFTNRYNGALDLSTPGKAFVFVEFPAGYVDRLDSILHPEWYAACFMPHSEDAALWAHYGDGHRGACLIFKAHKYLGRPFLSLKHATSVGFGGPRDGIESHEFIPVNYSNDSVQVDFFRSLGLPIPVLNRNWYFDAKDGWSECFHAMRTDEDAWRTRYWKPFERGATTKMEDWKSENEHRLLLYSTIIDFTPRTTRKLRYDFASLSGIVFGVKTSPEDKLRIAKIIAAKCKASGRRDFKFYQAGVSAATGKLTHSEWDLFKSKFHAEP